MTGVYLLILATSLIVSASLTKGIRNLARKYGLVPAPDVGHHIHAEPIPRIGGAAVFLTFVGLTLALVGLLHIDLAASPSGKGISRIVIPAIILFAVGLVDDLAPLRARTKLLIQISGGVYLFCNRLHFPQFNLQIAGFPLGHALSFIMTIIWVAWVCNGINFIDGLDGLAAGTTFFLSVPVFVFALHVALNGIALFVVILAGALLGFLIFNSNPASIFLGDSGSLFIGFLFSGFSLTEIKADDYSLRSTAILLVAFALPLFEPALSVLRRTLNGRHPFAPDREHIHHQLLEMGFSHRKVVWILYGVSTALVGFSLFLIYASRFAGGGACVVFLVLAYWGVRRLGYTEFEKFPRLGRRMLLWRKEFSQSVGIRKAIKLMRRANNPIEILDALECGLCGGFDGFDIVFDPLVSCADIDCKPEDRIVGRRWNRAHPEGAKLCMELHTPEIGHIGLIRIYWNGTTDLLTEAELHSKELAISLSFTLVPFLDLATREPVTAPLLEQYAATP